MSEVRVRENESLESALKRFNAAAPSPECWPRSGSVSTTRVPASSAARSLRPPARTAKSSTKTVKTAFRLGGTLFFAGTQIGGRRNGGITVDDIVAKIEGISCKEDFLSFLAQLAADFRASPQEWENRTVDQYLEAMRSWVEDFSTSEYNDTDWSRVEYSIMARMLYMGKLYE